MDYFSVNIYTIILFISLLSIEGGILGEIYTTINIQYCSKVNFDLALINLNINPIEYTKPEQISAVRGKNIIVISLESFEKGFLSEYPELTPNLGKLKKEMTYFKMNQNEGSFSTLTSMYTFLTGFPMFFKYNTFFNIDKLINHNLNKKYSSNNNLSKIASLSYILDKAGYNQLYIHGSIGKNGLMGGTKSILNAYRINVKTNDKFITNNKIETWGIHDKDLFTEAKLDIKKLADNNKPFAFYMSTISTHGPVGMYDKRMEDVISQKKNDLDFSAASVDYLIGDFMTYLKENKLLENTIVYIFPDHKLMFGANSKFKTARDLFVLTNATKDKFSYSTDKSLVQIDLPKLILEGAEVKHNATFLTDYIKGDKLKYIKDNKINLTKLNEASFDFFHQDDYIDAQVP